MANKSKNLVDGIYEGQISNKEMIKALKREMILKVYRGAIKVFQAPEGASEDELNRADLINQAKEKLALRAQEIWSNFFDERLSQFTKASPPYFLMGLPGHGKTSSIIQAAKESSEALGMNFVDKINTSDISFMRRPDHEKIMDFPVVIEKPGQGTTHANFGGGPCKTEILGADGKVRESMGRLIKGDLAYLGSCLGGVLILDDALNAPLSVQSEYFLGLAEYGTVNDLTIGESCLVTFTGNLGAAVDGSLANRMSTPLQGRVKPFYLQTDFKEWLNYMEKKNCNDPIGMAGLDAFFQERGEGVFAQLPDVNGSDGNTTAPHGNPRNWDHAYDEIRTWMDKLSYLSERYSEYGHPDDMENTGGAGEYARRVREATNLLHESLAGMVGRENSEAIRESYLGYRLGAYSLASNVLTNGVLSKTDKAILGDKYPSSRLSVDGDVFSNEKKREKFVPVNSVETRLFSYAYASSLAEQAATKLMSNYVFDGKEYIPFSKQEKASSVLHDFSVGMRVLASGGNVDNAPFSFCLSKFMRKVNLLREMQYDFPPIGGVSVDNKESRDRMTKIGFSGGVSADELSYFCDVMTQTGVTGDIPSILSGYSLFSNKRSV